VLFLLFFGWFVGGYIHAKRRLKANKPLLGYHRFLISYSERRRHGQVPQNHFTFYQTQNPYQPQQPYQQRHDGPYAEPPPLYNNGDAPPQYFAPQPPPGASKTHPNQQGGGMEMPLYGSAGPQGQQQSGVVGGSSSEGAQQQQGQSPELPPRPPNARAAVKGFVERFRK